MLPSKTIITWFLTLLACEAANAQTAATPGAQTAPEKLVIREAAICTNDKDNPDCVIINRKGGPDPFRGLHWGIGLAFTSDLGGVGTVEKDSTNTVRIKREHSSAARGAFEMHYFFKFCGNFTDYGNSDANKRGYVYLPSKFDSGTGRMECSVKQTEFAMGPFISLNTSPFEKIGEKGSNVFDSLGVGWMIGLNSWTNADQQTAHSLNVGVGLIVDTNVRQLAPGVRDGLVTDLPADALVRQTTKTGFMAMLSYKILTFNLN